MDFPEHTNIKKHAQKSVFFICVILDYFTLQAINRISFNFLLYYNSISSLIAQIYSMILKKI